MTIERLSQFLTANRVLYTIVRHSPAFSAQKTAAAAHVSGKEFAKTVIVEIDGKPAMVVLPAHEKVSLFPLTQASKSGKVQLATEEELSETFSECEVGAMPPFGNLFNMTTYLSNAFVPKGYISFPAGSHSEIVRLRYDDYIQLVKPVVGPYSHPTDLSWNSKDMQRAVAL